MIRCCMFALAWIVGLTSNLVAADNWKTFTSKEGNFQLKMPSDVQYSTQITDDGKGTMHKFGAEVDNGHTAYMVMYLDLTKERLKEVSPAEIVADVAKGIAAGTMSKLLKDEKIKWRGHEGRQLVLEGKADGKATYMTYRVIQVKGRSYQFLVISDLKAPAPEDIKKFLDSFEPLRK
jgi:hypothetical protein